MKKMKRILAIMLCLTMAISGPLSVFAEETNTVVEEKCSKCGSMEGHTEECSQYIPKEPEAECNCEAADEKHAETCPKYTVPEDNQTTNEESEPVVESCTECGSTEGHTEECSQYVSEESKAECNCEAIDEKHAETCPKYTIPEDNQTTSEELEPVVESCTECGSTEGHTEECSHYIPAEPEIVSEESESVPEIGDKIWIKKGSKVYKNTTDDEKKAHTLIGNYKVEITEIVLNEDGSAAWYKFEFKDLGIGEFWLAMSGYKYVQVENTSVEEPEKPTKPENPTEVELKDGTVVTVEGIPEDAKLVVEESSEEKQEIAEQITDAAVAFDKELVNGNELFYKTYNISINQNGASWQPEKGEFVNVEIDTGVDWLNYRSYVEVIHILDDVNAINAADTKYLYFGENLKELYPEACEAAENAGYPENCVVYTVMSSEEGEFSFNREGKIILHSTSFSDHIVLAYNVDNSEYLAETEDVGVKLNKTATYNNETESGTITLSSYVKGSVNSTPTDVVLVIDHSGSMWSAVDPAKKLSFNDFKSDVEHGKREGYYVAITKNLQSVGVNQETYVAYLIQYANNRWEISKGFYGNALNGDVDDNASIIAKDAFINTVIGTNRKWEQLTAKKALELDFYKSISGALYDALNVFMDEMKNAVNCRIAVVTFAGTTSKDDVNDLNKEDDYKGSGIFIDKKLTWDSTAPRLEKEEYKKAFEDPTSSEGQEVLTSTIEKINTDYGNTPTALGLLYARRLFIEAGRNDAQKIAIVFTDGLPNPKFLRTREAESCKHTVIGQDCEYCQIIAGSDGAPTPKSTYVDQANKLKTSQKATVYSIGPTAGKAGVDVLKKIASGDDKYYNVGSDDLSETFKNIAGVIVAASQELNKDSVVYDEITESFTLPEGTKQSQIKVYTEDYAGVNADGNDIFKNKTLFADATVKLDGKKVSVSNFDYKENAVYSTNADNFGKRLIIEIPIKENPDFLGGDNVETNEAKAGIYNGEVPVAEFENPNVNVNLNVVQPVMESKDIYLSQQAKLPEMINLGYFTRNNVTYQVDGINNAYVDIVYTIKDKDNNILTYTIPAGTIYSSLIYENWDIPDGLTTHPLLKEDMEYTVTCEVKSINKKDNTVSSNPEIDKVRVFKPEVTFNDSSINLGDTADYENNGGAVIWKHGEEKADSGKMGVAPTLEYQYSEQAGAFLQDTPVNVKVWAKKNEDNIPLNQEITFYTTFYRKACDFRTCEWDSTGEVKGETPNFVVHLDKFNLKIEKTGANEIDEFQTFIFEITKDNKFVMNVVIEGNGEVTVSSLPVGNYEVKEIIDWSWRYDVDDNKNPQKVELKDHTNGTVTVTFNNKRENPKWMDGNSHAQNIFGDNGIISSGNIYQKGGN